MKNWFKYGSNSFENNAVDPTSIYIIDAITKIVPLFFSKTIIKNSERTRLIKDTLSILGKQELVGKPEYKVYANQISKELRQENGGHFRNVEWLYDLHWYSEEVEPYLPVSLPLVVECEWTDKRNEDRENPFSGIKYDFQKLMVANADLRLMIFKVNNEFDLGKLDEYFEKAIKTYRNLEQNSKFLFIAFNKQINGFYYVEKQKGS